MAFINGKHTDLAFVVGNNYYTECLSGVGSVTIDEENSCDVTLTVTKDGIAVSDAVVTISGEEYITDGKGKLVITTQGNTAISTNSEYTITAEYHKSIPEEFDRAFSEIASGKQEAESLRGEIESLNDKVKGEVYTKEESDSKYATPEHIDKGISEYAYSKEESDAKYADALVGTVTGANAVALTDEVDLDNDVKVKASSINIPLGIGSVSFARQAGEHFTIIEPLTTITLSAGTYTLNVKGTCDVGAVGVTLEGDSCYAEAIFSEAESSASDTFTITKDTEVTILSFGNGLYGPNGEAIECYGVITPTLSRGIKAYPDVETDGIALYVYEKNLFNVFSQDLVNGNIYGDFHNCILLEDGSVKLDINSSYYGSIKTTQFNKLFEYFDGEEMTLSCREIPSDYYMNIVIYYGDGSRSELPWSSGSRVYGKNYCTLTLNHQGRNIKHVELRIAQKGTPHTNTTTILYDLQLEFGDTKTKYHHYICETYDVPLNETVVIPPLSDMTIISDTNGVEIEATYNKDINKVFAKQQAEIDGLKSIILELTTN